MAIYKYIHKKWGGCIKQLDYITCMNSHAKNSIIEFRQLEIKLNK